MFRYIGFWIFWHIQVFRKQAFLKETVKDAKN